MTAGKRSAFRYCLLSGIALMTLVATFALLSMEQVQYLTPQSVVTIGNTTDFQRWREHPYRVAIVEVADASTDMSSYRHAMSSVECYAKVQEYSYRIINDSEYRSNCPHKDLFFRRHCVVAEYMKKLKLNDYVLFIDSDIGVVNPRRRIEEFMDPEADIVFYDRFYNWEVMAGSYLVKNTIWAQLFLEGFADYEYRLPSSFHGTDNGAIHAFLAEIVLSKENPELSFCLWIYNRSKGFSDLFTYELCIRKLLGNMENFKRIKILSKGTAWARDNWLTNSKWNDERDFMIHNWKRSQLRTYWLTPLSLISKSRSEWYNPFTGPIELQRCTPGNTTWSYDRNLMATRREIDDRLRDFATEVENEQSQAIHRLEVFSTLYHEQRL